MTGSTPSGISCAEADEKTAQNDRDYSFRCKQHGPREYLARRQPGEVVNAQSCQSESGLFRDLDAVRSSPLRSQEAAHPGSRQENKIPKAGSLPVVTKMLNRPGRSAEHICRRLLETPNIRLPTIKSAGTNKPITGPAMYHGHGAEKIPAIRSLSVQPSVDRVQKGVHSHFALAAIATLREPNGSSSCCSPRDHYKTVV